MRKQLELPHGTVTYPAFFPDGTRGVVRSVDSRDLEACHTPGLVMNTFHLLKKPGVSTIKALGGLHGFLNWPHPIETDSGGFQVFSLIRENPKYGKIRENEIIFQDDSGKKTSITPEKCIQSQFAYGSDILMCLDYCTHPDDPYEVNKKAVDYTIRWAKKCKAEYDRLLQDKKRPADAPTPKLFGIIQGGNDKALRKECADSLIEIGFHGYGYGGWPMNEKGEMLWDMLAYTAELMPDESIKYAMGIGKPEEIVKCCRMGYDQFDCVIPTREARHNRLYMFREEYTSLDDVDLSRDDFYQFHYATDDKYWRDDRPISEICDCPCCQNFSRAYLRHLFIIGDTLAYRLATMHNLRFYSQLMELLAKEDAK